ncbi:Flp pilus assembly complex ATPase component TadA [Candidatus Woesearchaeota archaeon]|nr:Flp pilus assembly complex ATPase component TadA [Candidatus Woesearchaeota archaeon]
MLKNNFDKIVVDTSVLIEGLLSLKVEKQELLPKEVLIHEASLAELEHQANTGKAIGWIGLDEVKKLQELSKKGILTIKFAGNRPSGKDIQYAKLGEIDALIRQLAWEEDATLVTADKVQARVGEARGIKILFVPKEAGLRALTLEKFFDETTMSVHLRENVLPMAKKGVPGSWDFVEVGKKQLAADEIKDISREIIEEARARSDGFIEIEREGSTIIQLGLFRIVITKPPFSDGWEITAVRPVKKLSVEDYKLSDKLKDRIANRAEGMLIAGSPGQGKSTFAQALAEYFASQKKIVKTVEAPRDLVLSDNITQLSISQGSPEEIHDILLLSRPDYTIFDEMRNTKDFQLFADLRLAGVGMVGVVHGTGPIDAIQRFIGRVELGVIPQVVDTVVFIKNGTINKVLSIQMMVKVPSGMTEADLARPTVVIADFETGKPVAEVYSYGEETVVVPTVSDTEKVGAKKIAARAIERAVQRFADEVRVEILSENKAAVFVPKYAIGGLIGKEGKTIAHLEKELGIGLDVRELVEDEKKAPRGESVSFRKNIANRYIELFVDEGLTGKDVNVSADGKYVATFNVGKTGIIKIKKNNNLGKVLSDAFDAGEEVLLSV